MLCDKCNKNQASVLYTKIVNGKKTEQHLCGFCANTIDNTFTFDDVFKNVFNINTHHDYIRKANGKKCAKCGLTIDELKRYGRLGCDECVNTFREIVEPALKNIHSLTEHKGKKSVEEAETELVKDKMTELKAKLKEAIRNEEYEKAAEIRDMLRAMEKEA